MKIKFEKEIYSCYQCPFLKSEQTFTCDGWPNGFIKRCTKWGHQVEDTNIIDNKCKFKEN